MPRQARLDCQGTLHHIMIRGIEGRKIFSNDTERKEFVSRIDRIISKTKDKIVAWVLMDNHVHLLIFSGHCGISLVMGIL